MRVQKKFASCPHYVIQHIEMTKKNIAKNIIHHFFKTSAYDSKKSYYTQIKALNYQLAN